MLKYKSYLRIVEFKDSGVPKYRQLALSIVNDIKTGRLEFGDWLPSINDYASLNGISKATVTKAYDLLKEKGIIGLNLSKLYVVENDRVEKILTN